MKERKCKKGRLGFCWDYGSCETCDWAKMIRKYENKIKRKDKEIARLTEENERLIKQLSERKCVYLSDSETAEGCVQSPCPQYKTVEEILKENAELHARIKKGGDGK